MRPAGVLICMGRRVPRIVLLCVSAAVTIAIFAVAPTALQNRIQYGTFSVSGTPPRVDYCGRRYYPAPGAAQESLAQIDSFLAENGVRGLETIGTTPSGMQVVANVMSPELKAKYHTDVCTMEVWVRAAPGAYVPYGLSGGP